MVLRTSLRAMHRHLKNNTPMNTEVLWGGGLWWGNRRINVTRSGTLRCAKRCRYVQSSATRNALSVLPRAFEARRTGLEPATTGSTGRYRGIARSAAAAGCGLDENRVTRSVTLRRRNRPPTRTDRNCVACAIGCHEGGHRGDGCCQYEKQMNTPTACPITKTPSWTAQENIINNTPVNTEVLWGGGLWWGVMGRGPKRRERQRDRPCQQHHHHQHLH